MFVRVHVLSHRRKNLNFGDWVKYFCSHAVQLNIFRKLSGKVKTVQKKSRNVRRAIKSKAPLSSECKFAFLFWGEGSRSDILSFY